MSQSRLLRLAHVLTRFLHSLPGYTEWSQQCVPCTSTNGGRVFAFIFLSWVYVVCVHFLITWGLVGATKVFMFFTSTVLLMVVPVPTSLAW